MSSEFAKVAGRLEKLEKELPKRVFDAVDDGVEEAKRQMELELSANDTHWRGRLWMSLFTSEKVVGEHHRQYKVGSRGEIAPHNRYVEFGTGLHWGTSGYPIPTGVTRYKAPNFGPNLVAAIQDWVETKPVIPRFYDSQSELAFAISRNISDEGTSSQPFVRPAWFRTKSKLKSSVVRAVNKSVRRV